MTNQKLFYQILDNLKEQYDLEKKRAQQLSDIYGSDINPNDNSRLTKSIFLLLGEFFTDDQLSHIAFYCYDQDFGRYDGIERSYDDLWDTLIKEIKVVDPVEINATKEPWELLIENFRWWSAEWDKYDSASLTERANMPKPKTDFELIKELKQEFDLTRRALNKS